MENGYSTYDGAAGVSIVYRLQKASPWDKCGVGSSCKDLVEYGVHVYEEEDGTKDTQKYSNREKNDWTQVEVTKKCGLYA